MNKRNLAKELAAGISDMRRYNAGKLTLRTHKLDEKPLPKMGPERIRSVREKRNYSRAVFARRLRVSPRTLEKWEQGISEPNDQAKALLLLVDKDPEILERLARL